MTTTDPPTPERRWVTPEEAAGYLRVHKRTLSRMVADGRITGYMLSPTLIRYDLNEIDRMILASAQPTSGGGE
jgi:excisionase family DNA binding protein